ncbi:MAG: response regulator receiver protein [Chloroflexi bacterium]|nr:response regulator receiver protein [Chloroflexota bacterium]
MTTANSTVLVVDDDPDIQDVVALALEDEGYRVVRAVGGASIETAIEEQPQLVLLDLNMPGMDGTAVSQRLRSEPATKHIPIVIMSAAGTNISRPDLITDDWLFKPFDLADLYAVVDRMVNRPV